MRAQGAKQAPVQGSKTTLSVALPTPCGGCIRHVKRSGTCCVTNSPGDSPQRVFRGKRAHFKTKWRDDSYPEVSAPKAWILCHQVRERTCHPPLSLFSRQQRVRCAEAECAAREAHRGISLKPPRPHGGRPEAGGAPNTDARRGRPAHKRQRARPRASCVDDATFAPGSACLRTRRGWRSGRTLKPGSAMDARGLSAEGS